ECLRWSAAGQIQSTHRQESAAGLGRSRETRPRRRQATREVDRARCGWYRPCSGQSAMLARLRADLHVHTRAPELSARAACAGYRVLSITNHDTITYSADLASFARDHDVLLIPGVEATVEGRHVLVYNADVEADKLRTFADLRRYRTPEWLVAAPHPLFPASYCLREKLWQEIDLFDAIEFRHFYTPHCVSHRPAVKLAAAVDLPLLGTSDSHFDDQLGTTFSLIEADLSVESVLAGGQDRQ